MRKTKHSIYLLPGRQTALLFDTPLTKNGRTLEELDVEYATKHLHAIAGSVVSHENLHSFMLKEGEKPVDVMDLVGLAKALGVVHDVAQQCRMVFTDQNRVVLAQVGFWRRQRRHRRTLNDIYATKILQEMRCLITHARRVTR